MGMDLFIKKRKKKETEEVQNRRNELYKRLHEQEKEFAESYELELIEELEGFNPKDVVDIILMIKDDVNEELEEELIELMQMNNLAGLLSDKTEQEIRVGKFLSKIHEDVHEYCKNIRGELDILENRLYKELQEEIFYARKDQKVYGFLKSMAEEKGLIKEDEYLPSFMEVPFKKEELEMFIEETGAEDLEAYMNLFEDENIEIYGYHWS